jgi:uncharacterized protein YdhG (YjbR/CyaY superfamily)
MEIFEDFLSKIENDQHRLRTKEILHWVQNQYPQLVPKVAWNQPMFTDHGTFIIAFSIARNHLAMTPEKAGISRFSIEIEKSGYTYSSMIVRIPWDKPVDYDLIRAMIEFNLEDKKDCMTFWRKP